ncbi:MAG: hypothetical protein ACTS73_02245 [Arsenophonus sp. NEOnobi-MAG3]
MKDIIINSCIYPTIYATSHSHQTALTTNYYLEIEGLEFTEISLLASANSALWYGN